jgi:hypothetical protein
MGNYRSHYFGAYLEIKVTKAMEIIPDGLICPNGHVGHASYCGECGMKFQKHAPKRVYPTLIVDHLLGEEWEDVLGNITPQKVRGNGIILAIGNSNQGGGEWLYISQYPGENDPVLKEFPTQEEISKMVNELETNYNDIIVALRKSPFVKSVTVKAGYVLDEEY